ncbi:MAG: hypothetical protein ACKKL6_01235 [Candidatus Komeilibacteria bacterium]
MSRRFKVTNRWTFLATVLIAAFWGVYSIFRVVPTVDTLIITEKFSLELPFRMSRLWDLFIGIIWPYFFIITLYKDDETLSLKSDRRKVREDLSLVKTLSDNDLSVFIALFGISLVCIVGFIIHTSNSMFVVLGGMCFAGFLLALKIDPEIPISKSVTDWYILPLAFLITLPAALILSLYIGMLCLICYLLGSAIGIAVKLITNRKIWAKFGNFMIAKEP